MDTAGANRGSGSEVPDLPSALLLRVLQHLPPNEVACTARLVCKEWAEACSSPQQRTVRLSRPLPPHAAGLLRYWEEARAKLSFGGKLLSLSAAAASGCETNLEVAWALLQPCLVPGLPGPANHIFRAYGQGSDPGTVAATHGHGHLLLWLMEHRCPINPWCTLKAAAEFCDLATLRWAWVRMHAVVGGTLQVGHAAGRSRTPDALDKMQWLLDQQGCGRLRAELAAGAAALGDLPRLRWLQERGVQPGLDAVMEAMGSPTAGVEVVEWLEQQGAGSAADAWRCRAKVPLHTLEWLSRRPGVEVEPMQWRVACADAAQRGDLPAVAHLHEARGVGLEAGLCGAAAASGNIELLSWLLSRDCSLTRSAVESAVRCGNVRVVGWLLPKVRCPLPFLPSLVRSFGLEGPRSFGGGVGAGAASAGAGAAGEFAGATGAGTEEGSDLLRLVQLLVGAGAEVQGPEVLNAAAKRGDLPLVQFLHALGATCDEHTLPAAAEGGCDEVLRWVVHRGCSVSLAEGAYVAAGKAGDAATLRMLLRLGVPCTGGVMRGVYEHCPHAVAKALAVLAQGLAG